MKLVHNCGFPKSEVPYGNQTSVKSIKVMLCMTTSKSGL